MLYSLIFIGSIQDTHWGVEIYRPQDKLWYPYGWSIVSTTLSSKEPLSPPSSTPSSTPSPSSPLKLPPSSTSSSSTCAAHSPPVAARGWAKQEPSICAGTGYLVLVFEILIPAEPVQDIWQEKSRKIGNSLKWFQRVTFTFWIKMHRKKIFLLIFLTVVTGMPLLPVAQRQKQDIPSSHKYLVSFLFNPYLS